MKDPAETTAERKEGRGVWTYVYWVGGILVLYVLSWGPYAMMQEKVWKGRSSWGYSVGYLYQPLNRAYVETPLHKPLGLYLHLWCPSSFDKHGENQ
jgi:hypothetical protein